jgi:hypothetical protein
MALSDAINAFDPVVRFKSPILRLQKLEASARRVEKLADGLNEVDIKSMPDVLPNAVSSLREGRLPERRVTKLVCMGGLDGLIQETDGQNLVSTLLKAVVKNVTRSLVKALLIGYLRLSTKHTWLLNKLRAFLQDKKDLLPAKWKSRVDTYQFLSANPGQPLAELILTRYDEAPESLLNEAGLKGIVGQGGVGLNVFKLVCERLSEGHSEIDLVRFWNYVKGETIRFKSQLPEYAKALLGPYVNSDAPEDNKTDIVQFLLEHFSDPRIKPQIWAEVPPEYVEILNRWLTEQSFSLLMQVVKKSNDTKQWQERVRFWQPYIDAGYVREAWVALGKQADYVARGLVRDGVLKSRSSYGTFMKGSGSVNQDHSVIFIKIGDVIISEWTHSGKMRLYLSGNKKAPLLYRPTYDVDFIRNDANCQEAITHHVHWQDKAEDIINQYVNIRRPQIKKPKVVSITARQKLQKCTSCGGDFSVEELDRNGICLKCNGVKVKRR